MKIDIKKATTLRDEKEKNQLYAAIGGMFEVSAQTLETVDFTFTPMIVKTLYIHTKMKFCANLSAIHLRNLNYSKPILILISDTLGRNKDTLTEFTMQGHKRKDLLEELGDVLISIQQC
jgi:hypothetical protein